jgi:hypothetical protein
MIIVSHTYYYLAGHPLWGWLSIRIDREDHGHEGGDIKRVFTLSSIHVNKELEVSFCYSAEHFSDHAILHDQDLMRVMISRYGADLTYP